MEQRASVAEIGLLENSFEEDFNLNLRLIAEKEADR